MSDDSFIHVLRQSDGKILVMLRQPEPNWGPPHFGLVICDIARHVAAAFNVHEDEVWEWVDKERAHHTTDISKMEPQ